MIRTEQDLYMTYEERESFNRYEAEVSVVICDDCGYMEASDTGMSSCPDCGGSVYNESELEGTECFGCKESFGTAAYFYGNLDHRICVDCYTYAIPMDPKKGQSLEDNVREYEEDVY